ncbi:MAG: hypothetical protein MJ053_06030 [Elusimicrobiaceae bacterium]|nr:hypothetical protein [Elusimicrobiaceae bacterium]
MKRILLAGIWLFPAALWAQEVTYVSMLSPQFGVFSMLEAVDISSPIQIPYVKFGNALSNGNSEIKIVGGKVNIDVLDANTVFNGVDSVYGAGPQEYRIQDSLRIQKGTLKGGSLLASIITAKHTNTLKVKVKNLLVHGNITVKGLGAGQLLLQNGTSGRFEGYLNDPPTMYWSNLYTKDYTPTNSMGNPVSGYEKQYLLKSKGSGSNQWEQNAPAL